jgi:hypothetical protein
MPHDHALPPDAARSSDRKDRCDRCQSPTGLAQAGSA